MSLNILFATYPTAFFCPGGGEVQLLRNKAALERRGHQVLLFDQWHPGLDRVDVVHFFSVYGGSSVLCRAVCQAGKPLLVSSVLWLEPGDGPRNYPMEEIGQVLDMARLVLPNSHVEAERLGLHFPGVEDKCRPVVNGVDQRFFRPADPLLFRNHFNIHQDFVLCVANIEPRKNQLRLIRAMQGTGLHLLLLGNIRDREYWSSCQEAMDDTVHYLGYLEHDSELLRSAYAACTVFALPSLLETPGLAALEAAAMGAPLVITEHGCTREYFQDMARYVSPDSEQSIRDAVLAASGSEPDGALAGHVRDRFTWDRAAAQLETAYFEALGQATQEGQKTTGS